MNTWIEPVPNALDIAQRLVNLYLERSTQEAMIDALYRRLNQQLAAIGDLDADADTLKEHVEARAIAQRVCELIDAQRPFKAGIYSLGGQRVHFSHPLERVRWELEHEFKSFDWAGQRERIKAEAGALAPAQAGSKSPAKRGRRRSTGATKPLTDRQLEICQVVGECKGNIAEAARRLGKDRKTIKEAHDAANKKLGKIVVRHKTAPLPSDKRGQEALSKEDDRRG